MYLITFCFALALCVQSLPQSFLQTPPSAPVAIQLKKRTQSHSDKRNLISFLTTSKSSKLEVEELNSAKIQLKNYMNTQFTGEVGIGNPAQFFDVIFDTGSANFWINSLKCDDRPCQAHEAYDSSKSDDYKQLGYSVDVEFGTGSIKGDMISDLVTIAGIEIPDQVAGEITDEHGEVFMSGYFSGLLGLAYPSMAAEGHVPVFDSIMADDLLEDDLFTFYYSLDKSEDSQITLGWIDETKYTGDIQYVDVIPGMEYYWLIKIDDIRVGDHSIDACGSDGCRAAVDTGTSLLTAPSKDMIKLDEILELDEDHCRDFENLPDLIFVIDGQEYHVKPKDYVITMHGWEEEDPGVHEIENANGCTPAVMSLDVGPPYGPLWILGDIFMSSYYTIFNRDTNQVGFATANHNNSD